MTALEMRLFSALDVAVVSTMGKRLSTLLGNDGDDGDDGELAAVGVSWTLRKRRAENGQEMLELWQGVGINKSQGQVRDASLCA